MGLNLSDPQIGKELDLNKDDAQRLTKQLREGIECAQSVPVLSDELEADDVYIVAGHKGHPEAVRRKGRRRRLKAPAVAGRWPRRNRRFSA